MIITKIEKLKSYLQKEASDGLCIAFSGGVDSTLLLKVASEVLNDKVSAVTFSSRLNAKSEINEAAKLAESFNVKHFILRFDEFEDERIINNPPNRCYLCKKYIFANLLDFCTKNNLGEVADGTNADDLNEYRPGLRALSELGIISPLAQCGFSKHDVREAAQFLGLTVFDKPSAPCLATRVPYNSPLTDEILQRILSAENYIKSLDFKICRVRAYGDLARIEISTGQFDKFLKLKDDIAEKLKKIGFLYITLDIEGFRSGSMDAAIIYTEEPHGN